MKRTSVALFCVFFAFAASAGEPPHWAYPISVEKPIAPGADAPGTVQVPGSARSYTYEQIDDLMNPPDWFPDSHAPAPNVVMKGAGKTVLACGACHLMSGMGHPESSHLAGLSKEYILRQLADFKRGTRKDPTRMNGIARDLSDEDAEQAAAWFAALKPIAWMKVVETDSVPKSYIGKGRMRFAEDGGGSEAIGSRIIELPQDPVNAARRDPRSGFIAYVPKGSIARGEALVKSGGGKTAPCGVCHGLQWKGMGDAPPITGFSPLYLFRQLHSVQTGARGGPSAGMMQSVVARLDESDMIAIAAYLGSLAP
jgi:cytochrome c553